MKIINLTPHAITIRARGKETVIPPSGDVARVSSTPGTVLDVDWLPCPVATAPVWGSVEGLPDPQPGVLFLVSGLVAAHVSRHDVVSPGTGPNDGAIREDGKIVAVTRLVSSAPESTETCGVCGEDLGPRLGSHGLQVYWTGRCPVCNA